MQLDALQTAGCAVESRRSVIYVRLVWCGIMAIIRHIPEPIFNIPQPIFKEMTLWRYL
jgi:hypothetical protein